jgi:fatty-acyl-CoA synthase
LMAWVKLNSDLSLTIDELREFCQGKLAHYKIPRYLHVTDEFPMTVTGKIRKVEMREHAEKILRSTLSPQARQ